MALFILVCILIVGLYLYLKSKRNEKKAQILQEELRIKEAEKEENILEFNTKINSIPNATPVAVTLENNNLDYKISNITKSTNYEKMVDFIVIDVETTGLSSRSDEIIEIAAIKYNNFNPIEKISMLVKPKKEIPYKISLMTGITNEMVSNEKPIFEVMPLIQGFIGDYNLVGHNIEFDIEFLTRNGLVLSKKQKLFDNLSLSRKILKKNKEKYDRSLDFTFIEGDVDNYKLDTLCEYYEIYRNTSHRALSDCYATGLIYTKHIKKFLDKSK